VTASDIGLQPAEARSFHNHFMQEDVTEHHVHHIQFLPQSTATFETRPMSLKNSEFLLDVLLLEAEQSVLMPHLAGVKLKT
jgi:hypothetical protein